MHVAKVSDEAETLPFLAVLAQLEADRTGMPMLVMHAVEPHEVREGVPRVAFFTRLDQATPWQVANCWKRIDPSPQGE